MALAQDGTGTGVAVISAQTGSVTSTAVTAASAGDIIVIIAYAETFNVSGSTGYPSVSSITDTTGLGLSWQARGTPHQLKCTGGTPGWTDLEVWWAYAASTFSAATFTVNWTSPAGTTIDDVGMEVICWKGFTGVLYPINPWDGNASLPAVAGDGSGSVTSANVSGISTTSTAGAELWFIGGNNTIPGTPGAWATPISVNESGGHNGVWLQSTFLDYTSALSSATASTSTTAINWSLWVDALSQVGTAVPVGPSSFASIAIPRKMFLQPKRKFYR